MVATTHLLSVGGKYSSLCHYFHLTKCHRCVVQICEKSPNSPSLIDPAESGRPLASSRWRTPPRYCSSHVPPARVFLPPRSSPSSPPARSTRKGHLTDYNQTLSATKRRRGEESRSTDAFTNSAHLRSTHMSTKPTSLFPR
jgi:hypothetical protein